MGDFKKPASGVFLLKLYIMYGIPCKKLPHHEIGFSAESIDGSRAGPKSPPVAGKGALTPVSTNNMMEVDPSSKSKTMRI